VGAIGFEGKACPQLMSSTSPTGDALAQAGDVRTAVRSTTAGVVACWNSVMDETSNGPQSGTNSSPRDETAARLYRRAAPPNQKAL